MIYIDNGKTVKEYHTNKKIEKAVQTLLEYTDFTDEGYILYTETCEGYHVAILTDEEWHKLRKERRVE